MSRPYAWMSRVETQRIRAAAAATTSSLSRWVQGVCASSSTPAPRARSTCPSPCACAVTGRSAAWAASQAAISAASPRGGPASTFRETLTAAAPSDASSATAAAASSGDATSRPVPAGAHEAAVGYPPGAVSIGPAARISGPLNERSSEASASAKMRSVGHARSRTAVTPRRRTATGSLSSMWTCRSAAAGIMNPIVTTRASSGTGCTRPTSAITPPSQTICTSGVSRPGPSHACAARSTSRVMAGA